MNSSRDGGDHDCFLARLAVVTGTSAAGTVLAIEALMSAQAIDLRLQTDPKARLGAGTRAAYDLVRAQVPYLDKDAPMYPFIAACERLVLSGQLANVLNAESAH